MVATPDVAVIGAGVIGCAVARALAAGGAGRVLVIDRGQPGAEASAAAAGVLAIASSRALAGALSELKRVSAALHPGLAEALRAETGIDVEYERGGVLDLAFTSREVERLDGLVRRRRAQGWRVEAFDGDGVRERHPEINPAVRRAALFADDATVNAARLVEALHAAAGARGVAFRLGEPVRRIATRRGRVTHLEVGGECLAPGHVVIAAGAWAGALGRQLGRRIPVRADRGEMLAVRPRQRLALPLSWGEAWLVPRAGGEVLIGSTSDARARVKQVTAANAALLLSRAVRMVPALAEAPVVRVWSGLRPLSTLARPIIGPLPGFENVTLAVGHHRTGILLAPVTAQLVADLLLRRATTLDLAPFAWRRG